MQDKVFHDIVRAAINAWDGKDDMASFIAARICEARDIEHKIVKCRQRHHEENSRHEAELEAIRLECSSIRQGCQHQSTSYYGDASGGSDSYTDCNICGKQL